jgi:hypothetical protein
MLRNLRRLLRLLPPLPPPMLLLPLSLLSLSRKPKGEPYL